MTARRITLLTTSLYCLVGNIVGYLIYTSVISTDGLLFIIFIPYTFTWLLCSLVGFDLLAFVFLVLAYLFTLAIFFPIGLYFSTTKQDFKNSAFRKYLNITQLDKEKIKADLKEENANIFPETIDKYFIEFKEVYSTAEKALAELRKTDTDTKQNKNSFLMLISAKYIWLDKSNLVKLYDTCCFYLR